MRISLFALLVGTLVAVSPSVIAAAASLREIIVLDAGTYRLETGASTQTEGTPTGEVTSVEKAVLTGNAGSVAAVSGTEFGFRYRLVGEPAGAPIELDFVITFPATGLSNPETGKTLFESRYSATKAIGKTEYLGYGIEADWEAVPGKWSFEILHEGRRMARREFTLTR